MDERYWIVNDCLYALRNKPYPHKRQLELEVKFLRLRVELLKFEETLSEVREVALFENLKSFVEQFVADLLSRDTSGEILRTIDTILDLIRDHAAKNDLVTTASQS